MNLQIFALVLSLHCAFSINFKNNECSTVSDYRIAAFSPRCRYNPDVLSDIPNMAKNNGYLAETHTLTTSSGYILNLYRLKSEKFNATSYPIIVVHGIAIETGSWTNIGNRSLAFNLVEAGYDVWLASLRGTADSYKHTTWSINNPAYWSFSLDDLVKEDLDVQITHMYQITNQKILIIGHSMGTTISLMYGSGYPEKASQVLRGVVVLAPTIYLSGVPALKYTNLIELILTRFLDSLQLRGLIYQAKLIHPLMVNVCKIFSEVCYLIATRLSGETEQFLPNDLLLLLSYFPSGVSTRQIQHFNQMAQFNRFQKFDFGTASENLKHYNTSEPPLYNLSNVQVPVCGYYGRHDVFYLQENIDRLYNELGTDRKFLSPTPTNVSENFDFSHLDFVNSKNIIEYLYVPLLEKLKTFFN